MKKLFITAAIATMFSASVFADGTKKTSTAPTASYALLSNFNTDFATAKNVTWSFDNNFQKADFIYEGVKMTAFYNRNHEFVALTTKIDASSIPAKAQKQIAEKYKGYAVNEVIVLQNNTEVNPDADETAYFVDLKNDKKEILVRITPEVNVEFFQNVK